MTQAKNLKILLLLLLLAIQSDKLAVLFTEHHLGNYYPSFSCNQFKNFGINPDYANNNLIADKIQDNDFSFSNKHKYLRTKFKLHSRFQNNAMVWHRLRNNFCLNLARDNAHVKFHTNKYKKQAEYLKRTTDNAMPYIVHIMEQLEKRKLPGELALVPMIESSFNPHARSDKGAAGLWQLKAATGRYWGLKKTNAKDPRIDVAAATYAALNYLEFLHKEFAGDWFLALAAYNAGEGRVKRAIQHNIAQNLPTDFWSLHLPKETKNFVPKILALASFIKHAEIYEIANLDLDHNIAAVNCNYTDNVANMGNIELPADYFIAMLDFIRNS